MKFFKSLLCLFIISFTPTRFPPTHFCDIYGNFFLSFFVRGCKSHLSGNDVYFSACSKVFHISHFLFKCDFFPFFPRNEMRMSWIFGMGCEALEFCLKKLGNFCNSDLKLRNSDLKLRISNLKLRNSDLKLKISNLKLKVLTLNCKILTQTVSFDLKLKICNLNLKLRGSDSNLTNSYSKMKKVLDSKAE